MTLVLRAIAVVSMAAALFGVEPSRDSLVAHEWGTFTSVAGKDGDPVTWAPLSGPADLPCFVANIGFGNIKGRVSGLVRMETPILYFYSQHPVTLSVRVAFPQGWITEWYPKATHVVPSSIERPVLDYRDGEIRWDSVEVLPGETPRLPVSKGPSHYFAARETDSAPLRVGRDWEKLIFYRGVGNFSIPLRPSFTPEGRLKIRNVGAESIPLVIVFENRDGKIGYRIARRVRDAVEMEPPELAGSIEDLRSELTSHLMEFGLYRKEALAMVETWRDSWFEEGMRVFYLVPRTMVDAVLPLTIEPAPVSTARVFVGRVEMRSPGTRSQRFGGPGCVE